MKKINITVSSREVLEAEETFSDLRILPSPERKADQDKTFKIPPPKKQAEKTPKVVRRRPADYVKRSTDESILESIGFGNIVFLSEGKMGKVYKATWDSRDGVERAIKIVNPMVAVTELNNYRIISNARKYDEDIARHFADVEFTGIHPQSGVGVIVMELLENDPNAAEVIKDIFGGPEVMARADTPLADPMSIAREKDLSRRATIMLHNADTRKKIADWIGYSLPFGYDVIKQITDKLTAINFGSLSKIRTQWKSAAYELANDNDDLKNYISVVEEDLSGSPGGLNFIYYYLTLVSQALQTSGDSSSAGRMMSQMAIDKTLEEFIGLIRQWSPIGMTPGSKNPRIQGAPEGYVDYPGVASIKRAIEKLEDLTGLIARDMHDENIMTRYGTKDLVIVDVGLFKRAEDKK